MTVVSTAALAIAIAVAAATATASDRPVELACLSDGAPPSFAPLNSPPVVHAARVSNGAPPPAGAGCFGKTDSAATWITVASLVQTSESQSALLQRFGSVSTLLSVQYWSTTDGKWRPLVSSASALVSASTRSSRTDFSLAELLTDEDRYYSMTDTRSGRAVTYRLRVRQSEPAGLVVAISNVDAIKQWGITLYAPDGASSLYLLKKRSPDVWAYYSITRLLPNSFLAQGHEKSYINRAVALYRHIVGIATNTEPPSAP